ncbi:VOC family protein [Xanthomonas hortorum]|uniref:VOC family protein n=1 Tax=Xanthomonas hortorum pv. pelargonii TaxID=453602 RepID=A0A6V7BJP4_9XANT|nr:VOC family protein [Xanthomonas hortorum]MCE4354447.1 VOC family protein [Xanthomonas hortorum pv. pelargonii]MCM5522605.1 VOC family protein [Xanthomonas hortorum pv. pelargonii]MCM5534529.1 VOC family protein [Xanthomonas hortorum pv. pelargonii]MCM5539326.1 VOC family protein [Xanthomonas hortorum pv. pelargonii]MCM5543092.1 VOC family protein [Xanthomonas hortorum pv. pelargonii]
MTDNAPQHRIDYLEFAVDSIAIAKTFYAQAFDWTFQDYGPDYCEFRDGRLTGGFFHGPAQPGGALVVLASDDLDHSQARIEAAGGKITKPLFAFPGGRRFHFADPHGYALAVWSKD